MEQLRQTLQNFFDTHKRYLDKLDMHDTWIAYNCWAVREQYSIISPSGNKNKVFLENLDALNIKYHYPENKKTERVILSDLLVNNYDNPNAIDHIMLILKKNCVIIKNSDLDEYIESLRLMDRLMDETGGDKNLFTRITYIDKTIKYSQVKMRKIALAIFKKIDPDIRSVWISSLKNNMSVGVSKYFDSTELVQSKNKTELSKIINRIKVEEKERIVSNDLFKQEKKPVMSANGMYIDTQTMQNLLEKGVLKEEKKATYSYSNTTGPKEKAYYQLHGVHRIEENWEIDEMRDNSFTLSYDIKFNFMDLYDLLIKELKAE